jgi:hypothetical protein
MLSESVFLKILRRQEESGLIVKEFCTNEGIAPSSFYYWKKKLKKNNNARADFIPLVIKPSQSYSDKNHSPVQETRELPAHPEGAEDNVLLEVVYPNGTKLRIKKDMDLGRLRELICLYD